MVKWSKIFNTTLLLFFIFLSSIQVESITDHVKDNLVAVHNGGIVEEGKINDLKKRKLISKE